MESKWSDAISNHTSDPTRADQRVFVGNLKAHIVRKDIFDIFCKYGTITAISINRQGYGFVEFSDELAAQQALNENGENTHGCTLQVKPCSVSDARKKRRERSRSRSPIPALPVAQPTPPPPTPPVQHIRRRSPSRSPPPPRRGSPDLPSRSRGGVGGPATAAGAAMPSRSSRNDALYHHRESGNGGNSSGGGAYRGADSGSGLYRSVDGGTSSGGGGSSSNTNNSGGAGNYRSEAAGSSYRSGDGHRSSAARSPPRRSHTASSSQYSMPSLPASSSSSSSSHHHHHHHHRGPTLDAPRKPNDCEIVVMSKQQRDYAENVERRLNNLGLKVDVLFLKDEALLAQALDDLGLRGTLYACVIGEQHEVHNSVTLNVLYGVPQEHRNMPVDEALKFLSQNFREHLERQRDRDVAHDEREVKFLLKLLIESRYISIREYDLLIQYLTNKRSQLIEEEMGSEGRRAPSPHRDPPPSHAMAANRGMSSSQHRPAHDSPSPMSQAMSIEQQNQQLHDKIRSLIGTPSSALAPAAAPVLGAGVGLGPPPAAGLPAPPAPFALASGLAGGINTQQSPFANLNNPSVQATLDKLIKQGALGSQLAMSMPEATRGPPTGRRDDMGPAAGDKEPFPPSRGVPSSGYGPGAGPFDGYGNGATGYGAYAGGGLVGGTGGGSYGGNRDRSPLRGHGYGDGARY